ncbi:AMY1.2 [Symbiodinium necroappetens]|uniref:AMY1.2 protein n=1 Tax=Symbiodinium necroappetens TaxID=1628268 RepID=A0A812NJW1_9DINO|nr:AMY1.2 [Symbiodinium necroappetens]
MQMSRTASLMLVDMDEFCAEAEAEESHLVELERERLNMQQRRVASAALLEEMAKITEYADPSHTVMLQGFNWESHKAGKGNWYGIVESKVDMLADVGITDIWLPPPSQSVAPQGYLPSQLFNLDASAYGKKAALKSLLKSLHAKGMRGVADIVINHRCGDKQDEQGRWNVFTSTGIESRKSFHGIMDWQGWAITLGDQFSDGTGERGPGHLDGKFDAAPDIDHGNKKVQSSIAIWLRWLRLDIGFDAWRFDFVKGYGAEYVGHYCKKSEPSWAVGELWLDMEYDHDGLKYNQDKHRQDTVNWINGTDKESTAFDFTTKGILQEAVRNTQYWRLKDSNGKPPGLLGWMPTHAVTFLDNHDTGSTQGHWPFPNDKVLVGYAYILTHPGIPCIFWDHICDWGEDMRNRIKALLQLRRRAGIKVDDKVQILCADHDLYIAEIGSPPALRVALGPKHSGVDGSWSPGTEGADYRVWIRASAAA